ncbi:MAG: (Fe-S)-binding protein [Muribaculaceae bacterium]|nr:(Fe-S)-binding protein [Muribaculaceae bacterium]
MKVGLFIPCYVDALYPEVGVSIYRLLRSLGVDIYYPEKQTCCGQPMGNAGFQGKADKLVKSFDELFRDFDHVVAPSASCASYVRFFHPKIAGHECEAAGKTVDLVEFLHDILKVKSLPSKFPHKVSLHNSCHGVRELGLSSPTERNVTKFNKIKDLLHLVDGITVFEPERPDECCGFGGMFSVEETGVSTKMGQDKIRRHMATGAEFITGPDSSCLMHMQGIATKQNLPIRFIHVAQILSNGL